MLTYTFSRREKILLVILACVIILVAWYALVFQNVNNQVEKLDSQIASAKDTVSVDTVKLSKMNSMQKAIDDNKAKGVKSVTVPQYDNIQALMGSLNTTLAATDSYSLQFDGLDWSESGIVKRGVTLSFGCGGYAEAKSIITSLQQGSYPCTVDSVSMTDNNAMKSASASGYNTNSTVGSGSSSAMASSAYAVTAHITYYEKTS